jgi:hypothetical protein
VLGASFNLANTQIQEETLGESRLWAAGRKAVHRPCRISVYAGGQAPSSTEGRVAEGRISRSREQPEDRRPIGFGRFRKVPAQRLLLSNGEPVPLRRRGYDLLLMLVEQCPAIISKDELMQRVWGSRFVGDNALAVYLSPLRKALGDGFAGEPGDRSR